MSKNFFKHSIPNMIKTSFCESKAVADVSKFYNCFAQINYKIFVYPELCHYDKFKNKKMKMY